MTKTYQISFKTYLNTRLKKVFFHEKLTHPLYVQVTFDRKSIFFKSYYFELFSKPRYTLFAVGQRRGPTVAEIITHENALIEFVIDKSLSNFSLEQFQKDYAFYGRDLCDVTEEGFADYLYIFFQDKGLTHLASIIRQGGRVRILYDVVRDFKRALARPLYDELIENSFYYAPPYLPLFGFMDQFKKWPMLCLTAMEWESGETKAKFGEYMQKYYPGKADVDVVALVDKCLKSSKP